MLSENNDDFFFIAHVPYCFGRSCKCFLSHLLLAFGDLSPEISWTLTSSYLSFANTTLKFFISESPMSVSEKEERLNRLLGELVEMSSAVKVKMMFNFFVHPCSFILSLKSPLFMNSLSSMCTHVKRGKLLCITAGRPASVSLKSLELFRTRTLRDVLPWSCAAPSIDHRAFRTTSVLSRLLLASPLPSFDLNFTAKVPRWPFFQICVPEERASVL